MKSIKNTYRIFALTMALVMFTSSVNLAIDMHYCQGKLKSVSFFGKAKSCHDIASAVMPNCPHHQKMKDKTEGCSMDKKDCCNNKTILIQSDVDEMKMASNIVLSQDLQHFVIAFVEVFCTNNYVENIAPRFQYYDPPIVVKDISVLNQSFLI